MKRTELLFSAILVPVDYLMLVLAGLIAYYLRFRSTITGIRPVSYALSLDSFLPILLITALGFVCIFALSGLYAIRSTRRFRDEVTGIFLACSTGIMAIIVLFFFQRELFSSRFIVMSGWILAVISVTIGRLIARSVQRNMLLRHIGTYHVAVVGRDTTAERLLNAMMQHPAMGYTVVVQFPEVNNESIAKLDDLVAHESIDVLFQADPTLPKEQTLQLIDYANDHHITFRYAVDLFEAQATNIAVETIGGIPVIEIKRTKLEGWGRIWKRMFDVTLAVLALIVLSPVLLVIAACIKMSSKGPILYKSKRIGQCDKPFFVYKFRSMVQNAETMKQQLMQYNERSGPLFKMKNDPRVTKVGRFIRKTSLDELPQFFNVLRSEMSLVGPRPHEPAEVAQYEKHHRQLMTIKPGITGLAQISGRSDLEFEEEARLDLLYIENWSFMKDFSILLKTPFVVFRMKSAT